MTYDDLVDDLESRCDYVIRFEKIDADNPDHPVRQAVGFILDGDDGRRLAIDVGVAEDQQSYAILRWFDRDGNAAAPTLFQSETDILAQP